MTRIITLTLNPALDKSITVQTLVPEKKLKADNVKTEPGGGGINVSRALHKLGLQSDAFYLAGGYTGRELSELLKREGVTGRRVEITGNTRENFIVLDTNSTKQYRFGMDGPTVAESEWLEILKKISIENDVEYIVASGSLPPGISSDFYKKLVMLAREKKAKLIVDTSGPALQAAVRDGVFMIKPNLGELAALEGSKEDLNLEDAINAASRLIKLYGCEMIIVSMGAEGALLVTSNGHYHIKPPQVEVLSTVGAGDSMLAGLLYALVHGYSEKDMLAYGVAAGTAATLHQGTELCDKTDTDQLYKLIKNGNVKD